LWQGGGAQLGGGRSGGGPSRCGRNGQSRERVAEAGAVRVLSRSTPRSPRRLPRHLRPIARLRASLISSRRAHSVAPALLPKVETLQRRLRLHRLSYSGVPGTTCTPGWLRMVTRAALRTADSAVQKLRRGCSRAGAPVGLGIALEIGPGRCAALATPSRRRASPRAEEFGKRCGRSVCSAQLEARTLELSPMSLALGAGARPAGGERARFGVRWNRARPTRSLRDSLNRRSALTVHSRFRRDRTNRLAGGRTGEVNRLIHWLADARRKARAVPRNGRRPRVQMSGVRLDPSQLSPTRSQAADPTSTLRCARTSRAACSRAVVLHFREAGRPPGSRPRDLSLRDVAALDGRRSARVVRA